MRGQVRSRVFLAMVNGTASGPLLTLTSVPIPKFAAPCRQPLVRTSEITGTLDRALNCMERCWAHVCCWRQTGNVWSVRDLPLLTRNRHLGWGVGSRVEIGMLSARRSRLLPFAPIRP
jgi:hypothetical protein